MKEKSKIFIKCHTKMPACQWGLGYRECSVKEGRTVTFFYFWCPKALWHILGLTTLFMTSYTRTEQFKIILSEVSPATIHYTYFLFLAISSEFSKTKLTVVRIPKYMEWKVSINLMQAKKPLPWVGAREDDEIGERRENRKSQGCPPAEA